jgi:hypothetical protein
MGNPLLSGELADIATDGTWGGALGLNTPDGDAYWGYLGGIVHQDPDILEGKGYALYLDQVDIYQNAGIHKATFSGNYQFNEDTQEATIQSDGTISPPLQMSSMLSGLDDGPEDLQAYIEESKISQIIDIETHGFFIDGIFLGGDINGKHNYTDISKIKGQTWGIELSMYEGGYQEHNGSTFDQWYWPWDYTAGSFRRMGVFNGVKWSDKQINAITSQAWVNWDDAITGVSGGDLIGTYDPVNSTWESVVLWASMDTNKFMGMVANPMEKPILAALNIPSIEIGRADLSGYSSKLDVHMNDVTFFSYSTGADPRIWATNLVGGTYSEIPDIGHTVNLVGGGLNAKFKVERWDTNKWGANITDGIGTLIRTDVGGTVNVTFKGGGAGTYTGTTSGGFTGTASGVVNSQ